MHHAMFITILTLNIMTEMRKESSHRLEHLHILSKSIIIYKHPQIQHNWTSPNLKMEVSMTKTVEMYM